MKYLAHPLALFSIAILLLTSCDEKPPFVINFSTDVASDTTFIGGAPCPPVKVVVLEEFSGVRCVNCPEGHEQSQAIIDANPERVATVVIHAGFLTFPYPESNENYVLEEGTFLYEFLDASSLGVPAAAIDRVQFATENTISINDKNAWSAKVAEELQKTSPVKLLLHSSYDEATHKISVEVEAIYAEAVTEQHNLTVVLTESGIVDWQLTPDEGEKEDYVHNHVFRTALTPISGLRLSVDDTENGDNKETGRTFIKVFEKELAENWIAENCEIVAFIHKDETEKEIVQGATVHVIE